MPSKTSILGLPRNISYHPNRTKTFDATWQYCQAKNSFPFRKAHMKKIILIVFTLSFLTGCTITRETAWRNVGHSKVEAVTFDGISYIRVSGLTMNSSCAIKECFHTNISDTEMWLRVKEGLVNKEYRDGNFNVLIPIDSKTEKIYFGKERTLIWSKR
jgi:hypothetical protein